MLADPGQQFWRAEAQLGSSGSVGGMEHCGFAVDLYDADGVGPGLLLPLAEGAIDPNEEFGSRQQGLERTVVSPQEVAEFGGVQGARGQ